MASKVAGLSVGKPKMKEPRTWTPCFLNVWSWRHEGFAGVVEVLEDGFEAFGGYGFDADQGALDVGLAHSVEVLAIFAGFHGDLGEEDHVFGELRELGHECKALSADGGEFFDFGGVALLACEAEVGEGDGVEVVVGEGDKAEADAAEVDDLVDDALELTLAGLLAIRAPDAAEGTVLWAAADCLDGGPHVLVLRHEVPAGGEEVGSTDASTVVDVFGSSVHAVVDGFSPGDVSVSGDDGVGLAEVEALFGEERGVDAAVDDPGSALAGHASDRVAAEGVAGVDADTDDVAGSDAFRDDLLEGFVDQDGVASDGGGGRGEDKKPAGGDHSRTKRIIAWVHKMNAHRIPSRRTPTVGSQSILCC